MPKAGDNMSNKVDKEAGGYKFKKIILLDDFFKGNNKEGIFFRGHIILQLFLKFELKF